MNSLPTHKDKPGGRPSLLRTLIIWFLLLALLPMSIVAWLSYRQAEESLIRAAKIRLIEDTEARIAFFRSWFDYRLMDLRSESEEPRHVSLLMELRGELQRSGERPEDYVKSPDWRRRVEETQAHFTNLKKHYDYLYDVFLIGADGTILYSAAHKADLGANLFTPPLARTRFSQCVKNTLEEEVISFSDLEHYTPSGGMIAGFLCAPLHNGGGLPVGVLAMQITLDRIFARTAASKRRESSLIHYLVGGDGLLRTALGNKTEDILNKSIHTEQFKLWRHEHEDHGRYPDNMEEKPFVYTGPEGRAVIGLHRAIRLPGGTSWALISEINRDEALADADWLALSMPLLVVLSGLLAAFLAFYQARRITRPVTQLVEASLAAAEGRMNRRVSVDVDNEIGLLAQAFNQMLAAREDYEKALEESNKKNRQVLNDLAEQRFALDQHTIVTITDREGKIIYVNDKCLEISGYTREELLGQTHRIFNSGYHSNDFFDDIYRTIGNEQVWHGEIRNRAKDGSIYWLDTSIVPFRDVDGKPRSYIIIRTDITERKQAELELRKAKESAETANQAKGEFLANMSHEIRTPMNAVIGFAGILQQTELNEKQRDYLRKIKSSAYALLNLLNDVLDFSKIEVGKLAIERVYFQLDDILDNLSEVMGRAAVEKGLELSFLIEPKVPRSLEGDPLRLRQILLNLIDNAVKFTMEGKIVVTVAVDTSGEDSETREIKLRFSVEDTGIGLTPQQAEHLFQPFTQGDGSITRRFGGTGLGLTISKKLAELMGGNVGMESEAGVGSTFWFTAVFVPHEIKQRMPFKVPPDLRGIKVLVVDDSTHLQQMLAMMLRAFSFVPVAVESGEEALSLLAAGGDFRLVIVDWKLPDMDGVETAERIIQEKRANAPLPKIIMLTAFNEDEVRQLAGRAPIDAFLLKPVTQSILFDNIITVFEHNLSKHEEAADTVMPEIPRVIQGAHILLVEDNRLNQQLAEEVLHWAGLRVSVAVNGKKALQMLENEVFDAVLMDVQMPEMDGYEATRRIKTDPRWTALPVIAMTAHVLKGDKEKCLAAGMDAYIGKPINIEQLISVLEQWVKPRKRPLPPSDKARQSAAHPDNLPANLAGVNISRGLSQLGGNKALFKKFLRAFPRDNTDVVQNIRTALEQGDSITARRLAHSLKGNAANLAMEALSESAQALEVAVMQGDKEKLPDLLQKTQEYLQRVLQSIAQLGADDTAESAAAAETALDTRRISPMLKDLESLLKQRNMKAKTLWKALKAHLCKDDVWQDKTVHLDALIETLQFKEAQIALAELNSLLDMSVEKN